LHLIRHQKRSWRFEYADNSEDPLCGGTKAAACRKAEVTWLDWVRTVNVG
jgi:hypothetical protein